MKGEKGPEMVREHSEGESPEGKKQNKQKKLGMYEEQKKVYQLVFLWVGASQGWLALLLSWSACLLSSFFLLCLYIQSSKVQSKVGWP